MSDLQDPQMMMANDLTTHGRGALNELSIRHHSHMSSPKPLDRGKELLTITVEIGDGQRENILIYENDTASFVAEEFCAKYVNISDDLKEAFTQQIDENM